MTSTAASGSADARRKHIEALQRAIPVTRMVDYGVPLGDALRAHALTSGAAPPPWDEVCESLAERHVALATRSAHEPPRPLTAAQAWRAASALLQCAQLAFNDDSARKVSLYERAQSAMVRHAEFSADLAVCEVSTQAGPLHGWTVKPARPARAAVLVLGGLSGWGAAYLDMGRALAACGVLAVLAEGPGQGLSRLRHGIAMTPHNLPLLSAFLDHASHAGAERFGVWGNSFGGLLAAHVALHDTRVRSVCINGAPPSPTVPAFRTAREQMAAAFRTPDDAALAACLRGLAFDPVALPRLAASVLVLQGGRDGMLSLGEQAPFIAMAQGQPTETLTWEDGEHTIYNHAQERNARVADWFAEQLHEERRHA